MSEKTIYNGCCFVAEWYYDNRNKSQALEYFTRLTQDRKIKFLRLIKLICEVGKILDITKFRNEGNEIYVFKSGTDRFFRFFHRGKKIIVTNAYEKKSRKMSTNDKNRARRCKDSYVNEF